MAMLEGNISQSYRRKHRFLHPHFEKGNPYVAVFAYSVGPVAPWFDWKSIMVRNLKKQLKDYARQI